MVERGFETANEVVSGRVETLMYRMHVDGSAGFCGRTKDSIISIKDVQPTVRVSEFHKGYFPRPLEIEKGRQLGKEMSERVAGVGSRAVARERHIK